MYKPYSGELYTWGCGEYGRLGHGDNVTQLRPKLVKALTGHRVIQVRVYLGAVVNTAGWAMVITLLNSDLN